MADFNDELYYGGGNIIWKLNGTGDGLTFVDSLLTDKGGDSTSLITALEPFQVSGTDYLFIALGTSTPYYYMTTAEAFTQSTATNNKYKFFKRVNTTADTLYGSDGDNTIRSTTNPLNGGIAWSDQTIVGDAFDAITELVEKDGALYIMKEDMPYYLDSSGNVQKDLAPELKSARASTSGKNAHIWKGELFIPAGDQALIRIGTSNSFISPSKYCTNLSDFAGRVQALASDEEWLFIALDNGAKVEILKGREETIDGSTSWNWHPFHELTLTNCEKLHVSTVYQKRLWIASTASSDSLYYLPLPTQYGDLTTDSNRNFKTGTYFETSFLHGNFRGDKKAYIKQEIELGHDYDAGIYFSSSYKKLGDSSWTSIGNFVGTATDRTDSLFIPADASSNNPVSTMMKFKITAVTNDTAKTPLLLNYKVSAVLYPTIRRIIYCKVLVAEEVENRLGMMEKNRATVITTINNLRSATWPVSIRDINGDTVTVKYLPLPKNMPKYQIIRDERGREKERHYNLLLQEVALS
jgi:hypothetical protein